MTHFYFVLVDFCDCDYNCDKSEYYTAADMSFLSAIHDVDNARNESRPLSNNHKNTNNAQFLNSTLGPETDCEEDDGRSSMENDDSLLWKSLPPTTRQIIVLQEDETGVVSTSMGDGDNLEALNRQTLSLSLAPASTYSRLFGLDYHISNDQWKSEENEEDNDVYPDWFIHSNRPVWRDIPAGDGNSSISSSNSIVATTVAHCNGISGMSRDSSGYKDVTEVRYGGCSQKRLWIAIGLLFLVFCIVLLVGARLL